MEWYKPGFPQIIVSTQHSNDKFQHAGIAATEDWCQETGGKMLGSIITHFFFTSE